MTKPPGIFPIPLRGPLTPAQEAYLRPRRPRFAQILQPLQPDPGVTLVATDDPDVFIAHLTEV